MVKQLTKLLVDFRGLARVCGLGVALRWLGSVLANFPAVVQRGDLQPADAAMGVGPFAVRLPQYGAAFSVAGVGAISGIREMYVRDTYLRNGALRVSDGDTVVDLGANMGNFTNLALACGPNVRVVAVEPSAGLNEAFRASVGLNRGHAERVKLIRAFVGRRSEKIVSAIQSDRNYADAPWISESQLIEIGKLSKIDFLKCDIEGGEFGLLDRNSKLLAMARSLAIEIHAFEGNVDGFIEDLRTCGFSVASIKRDPDGTATVLARRQ